MSAHFVRDPGPVRVFMSCLLGNPIRGYEPDDDPAFSKQPGRSADTEHLQALLRQDDTHSAIMMPGKFYEKDDWIESLPMIVQRAILNILVAHLRDPNYMIAPTSNLLGVECLKQFELTDRNDLLDSAIAFQLITVKYMTINTPSLSRIDMIAALANSCRVKYRKTVHAEDFDIYIHFLRIAVRYAVHNHLDLRAGVFELASALSQRWLSEGAGDSWENRGAYKSETLSLMTWYLKINPSDLKAVDQNLFFLYQLAHEETDKAKCRDYIAGALDLAESSLESAGETDEWRGLLYYRTAQLYSLRWKTDYDINALNRAVDLATLSLRYTSHEAFWDFACTCADITHRRHDETGSRHDLDASFKAIYAAIGCLGSHKKVPLAYCNRILGNCFKSEYAMSHKQKDLEKAQAAFEKASVPGTCSEEQLAMRMNDLAHSLYLNFERTFSLEMLNKCIETYVSAIDILGKSGLSACHDYFMILKGGIAKAMLHRYNHWGFENDLKSAWRFAEEVLQSTDKGSAHYPGRVCVMSTVARSRYRISGDLRDLQVAQSHLMSVIQSPNLQNSVNLGIVYFNMGHVYIMYYDSKKDESDLDQAIHYWQEAESFAENRDLGLPLNHVLLLLAGASYAKATHSGQLQGLLDSVASLDKALARGSNNALMISNVRYQKGEALSFIFQEFKDKEYGRGALQEYSYLVDMHNAPPDMVLHSASKASRLEIELNGDHEKAYFYIRKAIAVFSDVVMLVSNRSEQLKMILEYQTLPFTATHLAIKIGRPASLVLSELEKARAFMWDRLLLAEIPLDALRRVAPDLADQFEALRNVFTSQRTLENFNFAPGVLSRKDQIRLDQHESLKPYKDLLDQIRRVDGFANFLLPSTKDETGPTVNDDSAVVYFIVHPHDRNALKEHDCDCNALIKTSQGVQILAIPDLKLEEIMGHLLWFRNCVSSVEVDFEVACSAFNEIMLWLWKTFAKPILEFLDQKCEMQTDRTKRRVYWVTSGLLGMLPIHAAGDWTSSRKPNDRPSVHERVISSYIPSVRVLEMMRRRTEHPNSQSRNGTAVLVGMPQTRGLGNLEAAEEIQSIINVVEDQVQIKTLLEPPPRVVDVLSALDDCELAHFACHGRRAKDPSKSALMLTDGPLRVQELVEKKIPRCQLAFLSACDTAFTVDLALTDECLNVAGSFLMAGVPHVVAGMWQVEDDVCLKLAPAFYALLFSVPPSLRYQDTATALHTVVDDLIGQDVKPLLWGAFVHMGP